MAAATAAAGLDRERGKEAALNKAPEAFRTITEVADELDLPQHVLRFWESRFPHIKPMKRGGGRRYYRREDVELLRGIRRLLYADGYTIRGVQRILREQGVRIVQSAGQGQAVGLPDPARADRKDVEVGDALMDVPPVSGRDRAAADGGGDGDGDGDGGEVGDGGDDSDGAAPVASMQPRVPAGGALTRQGDGDLAREILPPPPPAPAAAAIAPTSTAPQPILNSTELDRLEAVLAELEACRRLLDRAGGL